LFIIFKGSTTRYGSALSQQRLKNPAVGSVPGYVVLPLEHQTQVLIFKKTNIFSQITLSISLLAEPFQPLF
jgi:hypothetical protein